MPTSFISITTAQMEPCTQSSGRDPSAAPAEDQDWPLQEASLASLTTDLCMYAKALLTPLKVLGMLLSLEIIPFLLLQGRQNALNSSLHGKSMPGFPDLSIGKAPTWSMPENNHLWMNNTLFPHSIICCHALHSPQGKNYPQLQVGQTITTDFVLTQAGASRIFLVVSAPCEQLNWAG